jgi:hypothetical protein
MMTMKYTQLGPTDLHVSTVARVPANPAVDVAIVRARHPRQLVETVKAADVHLTPETLSHIQQIMREAVPMGGPTPETM